jgi:hypothetical protein
MPSAESVRIGTRATKISLTSGQSAAISGSMVVLLAGTISSAFGDFVMAGFQGERRGRGAARCK